MKERGHLACWPLGLGSWKTGRYFRVKVTSVHIPTLHTSPFPLASQSWLVHPEMKSILPLNDVTLPSSSENKSKNKLVRKNIYLHDKNYLTSFHSEGAEVRFLPDGFGIAGTPEPVWAMHRSWISRPLEWNFRGLNIINKSCIYMYIYVYLYI